LKALLDLGYEVALETAGSHDLSAVDPRVVKIVDRKTPGSGESAQWLDSNLAAMVSGQDELKFVLCGEEDYHWAKAWCRETGVLERFDVLFSPVWGRLDPTWLAEQIVKDNLPVRFQLQLHKLLWGPDKRGV
jgi:7-carboxy-7-deazaguanine synthase